MPSFHPDDRALLIDLVPMAQHLIKNYNYSVLLAWMYTLSGHERAMLVLWAMEHGDGWPTATVDPSSEDERMRIAGT